MYAVYVTERARPCLPWRTVLCVLRRRRAQQMRGGHDHVIAVWWVTSWDWLGGACMSSLGMRPKMKRACLLRQLPTTLVASSLINTLVYCHHHYVCRPPHPNPPHHLPCCPRSLPRSMLRMCICSSSPEPPCLSPRPASSHVRDYPRPYPAHRYPKRRSQA